MDGEKLNSILKDFMDKANAPITEEVLANDIKVLDTKVNTIEKELTEKINETLAIVEEVKKQEGPAGYTPQKGVDYEDGKDYVLTSDDKKEIAKAVIVPEKIIERIEVIKEQPIVNQTTIESPIEGEAIVNKINDLPVEDEFKIDAKHIKNLPKPKSVQVISSGNMQIYVDGVLKSTSKYLNFVGGTSMSLSASRVGERTDILFDATAGTGGLTQLTATGTVDGSNTTFTFVSKPTYLVVDGAWQRENFGWTWSVPTATLTVPPQSDIYGLS